MKLEPLNKEPMSTDSKICVLYDYSASLLLYKLLWKLGSDLD